MKFLSLLSVLLLIAATSAQDTKVDENCDRILSSMVDGCKTIRNSLISPPSMDSKVLCCINFRYNICVQSVKGYATVARATRICPEQIYETKIADLESNIAMSAVKTVCDKFESQTCITEPVSNAWNTVKTNVQSNIDVDRIGEQIGKNWNDAMSSLSSFAKGVQESINQQNIPGRLQESATALQSTIRERTKQLTDMVSGQAQNRYSIVGNEGKDDAISLDSIVNSVIPDVEIVPKAEGDAPVKTEGNGGKRFSIVDWIGSLTPSFGSKSANSRDQPKSDQIEQRGNPYSLV